MKLLSENEYQAPRNIYSRCVKLSRRSKQIGCPNRLVSISREIHGTEHERSIFHDIGESNVEISNLFSRSKSALSISTAPNTGKDSNTRPEKRKVSILKKKECVLDRIDDKRSFQETQGLGIYAIDFFLSKEKPVCVDQI
ncbi:hypothetical protein AYI69_g10949 [Smittium culicis]|uniref:Uncharacterized protein n=1 Tax=Smittium culicis TaxID=133412 RepID=A0A1R1X293_9FUNG|nr:hypothetical protein AYI69_g10949 [Smittium culicis]